MNLFRRHQYIEISDWVTEKSESTYRSVIGVSEQEIQHLECRVCGLKSKWITIGWDYGRIVRGPKPQRGCTGKMQQ